jgi:hypothetical protein
VLTGKPVSFGLNNKNMDTLQYILDKYKLEKKAVIEIPNTGRDTMASILHELDFKVGVEVGVQEAYYSVVLCRENPQMLVYGVDPWMEFRTGTVYKLSQQSNEYYYKMAQERLSVFPNSKLIRKTSMDAVKDFPDESLDFVYIDADHEYSHVMEDITEWSKKLKKGGIMSGHDYYKSRDRKCFLDVKAVVHTYIDEHNISPLIIWGVNAKDPGTIRDRWRSWSWVK